VRRAAMCLVLLVVAGGGLSAGCGSEPNTNGAATTVAPVTTEPTAIVPDAAVTAGLAATRAQAAKVRASLASGGTEAAKADSKAMYELWYAFEATVRKNARDLYLKMEDGLADIQAGARDNKPDRIDRGLKDLAEGADAYLEQHP
jgi:hypothetical protein